MAKVTKRAGKVAVLKPKAPPKAPPMSVRVVRTQMHFYKDKLPRQAEYVGKGLGTYFLLFEITAGPDALFIPISIATGRKSAGFLYVVEGGGVGIPTALIQDKGGKEISIVTSGSIVYTKIPPGKTASFVLNAEIVGELERSYKLMVNTISYKTNPNDYRYKKFQSDLGTETLTFRSIPKK